MPKRFGKYETWRRRIRERHYPPALRAFQRALHDPHFDRALHAWMRMRRDGDSIEEGWASDAEYCMDRTEIN